MKIARNSTILWIYAMLLLLSVLCADGATVSPKGKEVFAPTLSVLRLPRLPEVVVQRAVSNVVSLAWTDTNPWTDTNQPAARYRVAYGPNRNTLTTVFDAGSTNVLTITNNPTTQQLYGVRVRREEKESAFSALVKYPPDIIRDVYVESATSPSGPWQRDVKPVKSFTNTPAIPMQVFRLKIDVRKDYSP